MEETFFSIRYSVRGHGHSEEELTDLVRQGLAQVEDVYDVNEEESDDADTAGV